MVKLLFVLAILYAGWWLLIRKPKRLSMGEREARALLGVKANADADAIRAAHRRLVAAVHPDRGGSAELTRQLNVARDTLLKRAVR